MMKYQKEKDVKDLSAQCRYCGSDVCEYWDETDEEVIFKCSFCGKLNPHKIAHDRVHFYLQF